MLGAALIAAGHRVVAASGRGEDSRDRAAALLQAPVRECEDVVARSELVLLTPPARELCALVERLRDAFRPGQIVLHTHPRFGIGLLADIPHILPIALHPATRFTGTRSDLARLQVSRAAVTARGEHRAVAEALAVEMGAEPFWVDEQGRAGYAAAIALLGDHLHGLFEVGVARLRESGVEQAPAVLAGYLQASADVVASRAAHPHGAAETGDAPGLASDIAALAGGHPDARPAYRDGARVALATALRRGEVIDLRDDAVFDALRLPEVESG